MIVYSHIYIYIYIYIYLSIYLSMGEPQKPNVPKVNIP